MQQLLGCGTLGKVKNSEGPVGLEKEGSLESWKEVALLEILVNLDLELGVKLAPSAPKSPLALQSSDCFDGKTRSLSVDIMQSWSDLSRAIVRLLPSEPEGLSDG